MGGWDKIILRISLAILVVVAVFGGVICVNTYGDNTVNDDRMVIKVEFDSQALEEQGYICTYQEKEYELNYIRNEGWFIIDRNWKPYPLMYRLDYWLDENTPTWGLKKYLEGYRDPFKDMD